MFPAMPVQPLISADPLFKSGSGDHLFPASQKFDDLNLGPIIGGAVAGIVAIAAIVFFVMRSKH